MKHKSLFIAIVALFLTSCDFSNSSVSVNSFDSQLQPSVISPSSPSLPGSVENSTSNASSKPTTTESLPSNSPSLDLSTNISFGDENIKEYYKSVDFSTNGEQLLSQLQSLNRSKISNKPGYSGLWNYYNQTDYDPNDSSKYIAFYRGTSATKSQMNKEHVWPKSHGGNLVEGDLHMTRPTLSNDNSSRGNSFYVEGKSHSSNGWDPYADGMTEYYRGIAARIIFYCVVAEPRLSLIDEDYHPTSNANPDYMMGKLSDLLKWNLEYDIDYTEINRNNGIEKIQHNRNPFIDNRALACKVWGDYNEETKKICSANPDIDTPPVSEDPVKPTKISIEPSTANIKVGSSLQLSASFTPSNAIKTVNWQSSNNQIASVTNSGFVNAISEGTAKITATSIEDSNIVGTATITVKSSDSTTTGEYNYSFEEKMFSAKPSNETKILNEVEWTMTHDGNYAGYDSNKGQQFGSSGNPLTTLELSTTAIPGTIEEIVVTACGASSTNAVMTISVGDTKYLSSSITSSIASYEATGANSGKIIIKITQTSKKAVYIKAIKISYTV